MKAKKIKKWATRSRRYAEAAEAAAQRAEAAVRKMTEFNESSSPEPGQVHGLPDVSVPEQKKSQPRVYTGPR